MNIYEGIAHGVVHEEETARETGEQLIGFSVSGEEEVTRTAEKLNLPPLEQWACRGDVAVRKDDAGWIVSLGAGFDAALVSLPLEGEWSGKGIELAVDLRLVSPFSGSLCLGVRDENMPYGSEGHCLLQSNLTPCTWHIRHLGSTSPVIYLKGNSYSATTTHIANVLVREISTMGLKPIPLPVEEKKKLERGERIDLTPLWQADGADIFPCPWSAGALEISFSHLIGGVYAQLLAETSDRKTKLTLKMRSLSGSFPLSAILGDDEGKTVEEGPIKRVSPCTWELERDIGGGGYVRLSCRTYGRETLLLEEGYCEVLADVRTHSFKGE